MGLLSGSYGHFVHWHPPLYPPIDADGARGDILVEWSLCPPIESFLDLQAATPQGANSKVALSIHAEDGAFIAGLSGSTSYGWLRVNMIWVDEHERRAGYARRLMGQAFDLARDQGCHGMWLETSNPVARDFYRSLGFADSGRLENSADDMPPTHARWFLRASLTD